MLQCDHHTREMPESSRKWMTDSFFKTVSKGLSHSIQGIVLIDVSLTVKAAALIFIPGCGSALLSAKQGKSGSIYNLVKN